MKRFLVRASFIGFTLSVVMHFTALLGNRLSLLVALFMLLLPVLFIGMFAVFVPFVINSNKTFGPRLGQIKIFRLLPPWVRVFAVGIFAYACVNFYLFWEASEGGGPSRRDGKFTLEAHGRVIREITPEEYDAFRANQLRGFSGHLLFFYFMPFAYFRFIANSKPSPSEPV